MFNLPKTLLIFMMWHECEFWNTNKYETQIQVDSQLYEVKVVFTLPWIPKQDVFSHPLSEILWSNFSFNWEAMVMASPESPPQKIDAAFT